MIGSLKRSKFSDRSRAETYFLLLSAFSASLFTDWLLNFFWSTIDSGSFDNALLVQESVFMHRLTYVMSFISYITVAIMAARFYRSFIAIAMVGFVASFVCLMLYGQYFTVFLRPMSHQNLTNLFISTLTCGLFASLVIMLAGKLLLVSYSKLIGTRLKDRPELTEVV